MPVFPREALLVEDGRLVADTPIELATHRACVREEFVDDEIVAARFVHQAAGDSNTKERRMAAPRSAQATNAAATHAQVAEPSTAPPCSTTAVSSAPPTRA